MWRVTWSGLVAHKIRYALTTLAVLLGVAFMAGTLVLTDTIGRTFDGLFSDVYKSTSAVVRATQAYEPQLNFSNQRGQIDSGLADRIRQVPGVTEVRIGVSGYAQLVGSNGKAIGNPGSGAPTLGQAWNDGTAMNPYRIVAGGRPPTASNEVVIDKHSADVGHLKVGGQVTVLTKLAPASYTITGIARWENADSPLGASITLFTLPQAQEVLSSPGKADEIAVAAAPGISQEAMAQRLRTALADPALDVVTGTQITKEGQNSVHQALSFFNTFLLAFALIALFVGSFLIFNTFSIVVAQRLRELALLRAVGASRLQIAGSVLGEAVVVGVVASLAGLVGGIGLAIGLRALLVALGIDIPATGLVVSIRTVVVSVVVGTLITVMASIQPARRAAMIAPIAAMRDETGSGQTHGVRRGVIGAGTLGAGITALLVGLFADVSSRLLLVGAGAAVAFVGLATLGPFVIRPAGRLLGALFAWRGPIGRLARDNAIRNPRRTSATAAALMVGVAVVGLMSVIASSIKSSVSSVVDSSMRADFVISSGGQAGSAAGFSPVLQQQLAILPAVASSTGVRAGPARINGTSTVVLAADPRRVNDLFDIGVTAGDIKNLSPTGIAISNVAASSKHLQLGEPVTVTFPTTGTHEFTVQAIYKARDLAGDYVLPLAAAEANFPVLLDFQVYVKLAPGVSLAAGREAIGPVLDGYPTAKLLDRGEYKQSQLAQIDQLLNLVYGLLALALFIALIGIANTLSLAIHERTRELGLLRAVGMTRGQLRSTIRYESLIIAIFGTIEGLIVGILLGWAITTALSSQGISRVSVPVTSLVMVAVLAALAGAAAAVAPGRRAARLDILRAIGAE